MLRVSGFTYVATWKGFAYVPFVIDPYARKILGWRVNTSSPAGFVLDAFEQAVYQHRPGSNTAPDVALFVRGLTLSLLTGMMAAGKAV